MAQEGMTWVGHVWSISYQHYDFSVKSKNWYFTFQKSSHFATLLPPILLRFSGSANFFCGAPLHFRIFLQKYGEFCMAILLPPRLHIRSSHRFHQRPFPPSRGSSRPTFTPASVFGLFCEIAAVITILRAPPPTPWDLWIISTTESTKNSFRRKIELLLGF